LLFTELGHEVVSQGAYRIPFQPSEKARPALTNVYFNPRLSEVAKEISVWGAVIPKQLIDWCEVVYILGIERWLPPNWKRIKHKHVVFRSIGQSVSYTESVLARFKREGLKIVRYSPFERNIPGYVGEDACIRCYKDENEWKGWNGECKQVITVAQAMRKREPFLKFHIFEKVTRGFPRRLYGFHNEDVAFWGGSLSYEELKKVLRDNRVYFYTGTEPASYTMAFQEAWMTGIPIVSIGSSLAGYPQFEVPYLIENGVNGFVSDSLIELREYVGLLLEDTSLARKISEAGRRKACQVFSKDRIKSEWKKFFESL